MARLKDLGNIWSTIRELDVSNIRDEANQPLRLAVVGAPGPEREAVIGALLHGPQRFPARGSSPLDVYDLPLQRERTANLAHADAALLLLDGTRPLDYPTLLSYEKLAVIQAPLILVIVKGDQLPEAGGELPTPDWADHETVVLPTEPEAAAKSLGAALVDGLPEELWLAAARRLPGLRGSVASELQSAVALSNATYALTTGLPEMIPVLNLPLNAADMLVLTKNQALMVYKIGLAAGAEGEFSAMIRELVPVIGGAFLWRQIARQLVGLIPGVGLLPKVAVAYAGTYVTGLAAEQWFAHGTILSRAELKALLTQALREGRERASTMLRQRNLDPTTSPQRGGRLRRLAQRVRRALPGGKPS